jgi:hypothetical protein
MGGHVRGKEQAEPTRPISAEYQVHEIMELVQHLTKAASQ